MKRLILLLGLVALFVASAPAERDGAVCGAVRDPEICASFARFERNQSTGALMIRDIYLNNADRG